MGIMTENQMSATEYANQRAAYYTANQPFIKATEVLEETEKRCGAGQQYTTFSEQISDAEKAKVEAKGYTVTRNYVQSKNRDGAPSAEEGMYIGFQVAMTATAASGHRPMQISEEEDNGISGGGGGEVDLKTLTPKLLTKDETLAIFSSTLNAEYYNGSGYSEVDFTSQGTPYGVDRVAKIPNIFPTTWLGYTKSGGIAPTIDTEHTTIKVHVDGTIEECYGVQVGFAILARGASTSNPPYAESKWFIEVDGNEMAVPFLTTTSGDTKTQSRYGIDGNNYAVCIVSLAFNKPTTVKFKDIELSGNFSDSFMTLVIAQPVVYLESEE